MLRLIGHDNFSSDWFIMLNPYPNPTRAKTIPPVLITKRGLLPTLSNKHVAIYVIIVFVSNNKKKKIVFVSPIPSVRLFSCKVSWYNVVVWNFFYERCTVLWNNGYDHLVKSGNLKCLLRAFVLLYIYIDKTIFFFLF